MKIEVGKKYRSLNGEVIHIDFINGIGHYNLHGVSNSGIESYWNINGVWIGGSKNHNLIEEITE